MLLGVESSCDDSSLALWDGHALVGEWVHTQLGEHQRFGGVVPDLASRGHLVQLPVMLEAIQPRLEALSAVAVTRGPGLAPCLAMGISLARALGVLKNIPVFGVNHLHGHAFSVFIPLLERMNFVQLQDFFKNAFPHLGLLVSGGNTLAFCIDFSKNPQSDQPKYQFTVLAQTQDDAAGEALDKGARLLGLPYPGGPLIEGLAHEGDASTHSFPQAFPAPEDLKFSFSGLKTSLRYRLEGLSPEAVQRELPHLCASYQEAVVAALVRKVSQISTLRPFKSLGLSGGVSKNSLLRERFQALGVSLGLPSYLPHPRHTGDNAAMIAFAHALDPAASVQVSFSFTPSLSLEGRP